VNILVTGAKGMLGRELCAVLEEKHNVTAADIDEFDITDLSATMAFMKRAKPKIVIHAAAMTQVDDCENQPDKAMDINAIGTGTVASCATERKAAMVYFSTDYVFDGTKTIPYTEDDQPNPLNVYGKSKLAGEQSVRTVCPRSWILRTAWLYGESGHNFVKTILRLAQERRELRVVNDQTGSPTWARDLAATVAAMVGEPKYGTYHVTNSGECSWYEFATEIVRVAGLDCEVVPIPTSEYPLPAKRPAYSVLSSAAVESAYGIKMRHWRDALAAFMESQNNGGHNREN